MDCTTSTRRWLLACLMRNLIISSQYKTCESRRRYWDLKPSQICFSWNEARVSPQERPLDFATHATSVAAVNRIAGKPLQRRTSGLAPTLTRTSAQPFDLAIQKLTFWLQTHHLYYPHHFSFLLNPVKLSFSPRGCLANSPINVDTLELQLLGHPDRTTVDHVLSGFREGFAIGFHPNCVKLKSLSSNCPSLHDHVGSLIII